MLIHNTVVGAFIANNEETKRFMASVKAEAGDSWKSGYDPDRAKTLVAKLKAANLFYRYKLQGKILWVETRETTSQGGTHRKVWIAIGAEDKYDILSLDIGTELCERLLPKLGAAVATLDPATEVSLSAFPIQEERNGQMFWNFQPSLKSGDVEIKASKPHFQLANEKVKAAIEGLKTAGITDPNVIKATRKSAKEAYFWDLAQMIAAYCAEHGRAQKTAA
jgi:hypothetical protein